uniref:Formin-like protein n=1 Tax=Kalanchoe fedtschenkoi TaxID=63787 RepID=A0A7N0VGT6_KALFE
MDVRSRLAALALALVFLSTFLAVSSYVSRQQVLAVDGGGHSPSLNIHRTHMAQLFWYHCGTDLINMNKAIEGLQLCTPGQPDCAIHNFDLETIRKATNYLHPHMKQSLRHCFIRNNLPLIVSGDEDQSQTWFLQYLESILPASNVPRRYLATGISIEPAASPSAPSPAPSPLIPDSPPSLSPAPSLFPPATDPSVRITPTVDAPPSSNPASGKSSSKHRSVAIAVGVTVPVTLLITALLLLCYFKLCNRGSALRRNDKRPLLSLSLNEMSDGPRQNAPPVSNSSNKEKRNGRVTDQTKAGDLHPVTQFAGAISSQASGFKSDGISNTKLSAESHGISSTFTADDQNPSALPGMVTVPPPVSLPLRPSGAGDAPPIPLGADNSYPHPPSTHNAPPPLPTMAGLVRVNPQAPGPPPPPMVKPVTAVPKPPGSPTPPKPPGSLIGSRPPPPPPKPPGGPTGSHPPPPPPRSGPAPPRPPPSTTSGPRPPMGPGHLDGRESESSVPKAKLKPFFWDKVLANPDSSMVWNQIKAGSFQFNEEMIETLFGSAPVDKKKNELKSESAAKDPPVQYIKLIDSKKAQNISILLKALNLTTEEVCDALLEGYELPSELFQTLLKMAPTQEEELKLRMFDGDISLLGPAERFLKALVDIPFAFKRIECLIFATSIQEEVSITKQSFATLEVACKELRSSRLFLKLLEAVLKTGNRMNDGTFRGGAQAFKLDTLLKLADVKGTDGKTTLLHFVVQEIIRSEGIRAARAARESASSSSIKFENDLEAVVDNSEDHLHSLGLEVVSHVSSELENVKKAAALDADSLMVSVGRLTNSLNSTRTFLDSNVKGINEESGFHQTLKNL